MTSHKIYLQRSSCFYKIELTQREYECNLYTTSTAEITFVNISSLNRQMDAFSYTPRLSINLMLDDVNIKQCDYIENNVFTYSKYGNDYNGRYLQGFYTLNLDIFKKTVRFQNKRLVYIFTGESSLDKYYIGNNLQDISVYETDSQPCLPDQILENVIIMGSKYKFLIKEVIKNIIKPAEIIECNFVAAITETDDSSDVEPIENYKCQYSLKILCSILEALQSDINNR